MCGPPKQHGHADVRALTASTRAAWEGGRIWVSWSRTSCRSGWTREPSSLIVTEAPSYVSAHVGLALGEPITLTCTGSATRHAMRTTQITIMLGIHNGA